MSNNKTGEGFMFIPNDDNTIFAVMMPVQDIIEWKTNPEFIDIALGNIMGVQIEYMAEAEKQNVRQDVRNVDDCKDCETQEDPSIDAQG